jgi:hypothetical protein
VLRTAQFADPRIESHTTTLFLFPAQALIQDRVLFRLDPDLRASRLPFVANNPARTWKASGEWGWGLVEVQGGFHGVQ